MASAQYPACVKNCMGHDKVSFPKKIGDDHAGYCSMSPELNCVTYLFQLFYLISLLRAYLLYFEREEKLVSRNF